MLVHFSATATTSQLWCIGGISPCQFQPSRSKKGGSKHLQKKSNCMRDKGSASAAGDILTPSGFWKIGKLHSLLFWVPTQDPSSAEDPFPGVSARIQPGGSAHLLLSIWRLKSLCFQALHSRLGYCTCLTVRCFPGCIEIQSQNTNQALDISPFLLPA